MNPDSRHASDDELVLLFYGETDVGEGVAGHVESCEACRANLAGLRRTLAVVDRHQIAGRDEGYGGEVWAHVQRELDRPTASRWPSWFAPRRLAFAGGLAVLLAAAFLAGRFSSNPARPPTTVADRKPVPTPPVNGASGAPVVRDRVLLVAVGDHLERSQMVLVELMNRPADGPVNISDTQEWARELVPTNRLIRETADDANEPVVADVLDALERTLVELANSPSELSKSEFEQVRRRIDGQGLVFKIRVLDSQVREREQKAVRAALTRS